MLLGVGLAWVLYHRSEGKEGFTPRLSFVLGAIRAAAIALIAFFLLEPMVRIMLREVRKPVVVIVHDGSSSLTETSDSTALRTSYKEELERLTGSLEETYEVRTFTYGQEVREGLDFDQQDALTDIGQVLREVYDRFSGPDLGAVVLDGDGIANRGRDPRLDGDRLGVPVFTIALGDTTVRPDLVLKGVEHNRICYLGNEFPLLARIEARHLKGVRSRVTVLQAGRELAAKEISVTGDPWTSEIAFSIRTDKPGLQRYTVEVRAVEGEHTRLNNAQDVFIDVLDDRQKVLLLGDAPHPDLGALRLALAGLEGYEVQLAFAADFAGVVEGYDLIVLHQLPSMKNGVKPLLQRAAAKGIPLLVILGGSTDISAFNDLNAGVRISGTRGAITDVQAAIDPTFSAFTIDPDQVRAIERFPPLQVPFGQYELGRSALSLARQRVGVVRTAYPLITIVQQEQRRMATICGEGIWRWRIADKQLFGSQERFDRLAHKLVQFLALKADRKRFRVEHVPIFAENEPVLINAELYNPAYEPVNTSEVGIVITDAEGRDYPYAFSPVGNTYRLDAGRLPAGSYTWKANAMLDKERFAASGELSVHALFVEAVNTVADHGLLADMAARSGGLMVRPGGLEAITEAIRKERTIAARSYAHISFSDLIGLRWIFFVLLAMLTIEWIVRRRNGAY